MPKADRISEGTKKGMAAAKASGAAFGTPANLTPEAQKLGAEARRRKAEEHYREAVDIIRGLKNDRGRRRSIRNVGMKPWTNVRVAEELNKRGMKTLTGKPYTRVSVKRLIDRYIPEGQRPPKVEPFPWER